MDKTRWPGLKWQQLGYPVAVAGLLAVTGVIHLDLYLTGYRSIPVIGWPVLVQGDSDDCGDRRRGGRGSRFRCLGCARPFPRRHATPAGRASGVPPCHAGHAAGECAGCEDSGCRSVGCCSGAAGRRRCRAGGPGPSAAGGVRTAKIGGVTVLTNARGFTLYWFALDTPSRSNCNGTCAGYWPPVTGTPAAGPGVTGKVGTIKRSDGTTQVTYSGHPLYTYIVDTAPGQAHGNNLNLNGGLWHEVTVSG